MKLISPFNIWPPKEHSSYGRLNPQLQGSIMSSNFFPINRGTKKIRIDKIPIAFSVQIPLTPYTRYTQPHLGLATISTPKVRLFKKID